MRKLILTALLLASAVPAFAQIPPPDVRQDRHDVQQDRRDGHEDRRDVRDDQRDLRQDRRDGDRHDYRDDRRELNGDRRDVRQDERREFHDDRRGYGQNQRYARFRGETFAYPRGYGYRYYGEGVRLPNAYWGERYYISRPDFYRLPPAYRGTRWVRIGPDALLIRAYDGTVIRSIRGLFY